MSESNSVWCFACAVAALLLGAETSWGQISSSSQTGSSTLRVIATEYTGTGALHDEVEETFDVPMLGSFVLAESVVYAGPLSAFGAARVNQEVVLTDRLVRLHAGVAGNADADVNGLGEFEIDSDIELVFHLSEPSRFFATTSVLHGAGQSPTFGFTDSAGVEVFPIPWTWFGDQAETFLGVLPSGSYTIRAEYFVSGGGTYMSPASYDVDLDFELLLAPVATSYCVGTLNANGTQATLSAVGSTLASDEDFAIHVTGALPDSFGVLFYGADRAWLPFSHAVLCVGGAVYRVGSPTQADTSGANTVPLDFQVEPAGFGPGAITSGAVWRFQYWYREPSSLGYQMSDGLEVEFQ